MTLTRLHNEDWGFETNCFVCEPRNEGGLQIPFFHDDGIVDDGDSGPPMIVAEFELTDRFSGAPTLVHGGVTLAVLDEAMAWACIAIGGQWAVTSETTTKFHRAVRVGSSYRVEATVVDHVEAVMRAEARVSDLRGVLRAEAAATFTTLGEAQAARIAGIEVSEANRSYLAGGHEAAGSS